MPPRDEELANETTALFPSIQQKTPNNPSLPLKYVFVGILAWILSVVWAYHYQPSPLPQDEKTEATPPKPRSKYTKVQGMGFNIYTGPAPATVNGKRNPECTDAEIGSVYDDKINQMVSVCYMGHENSSHDVQRRLVLLEQAVKEAAQIASTDPSILKVFIVPEFYWRGVTGAYQFMDDWAAQSDCGAVCQVLRGLEALTQKYSDDWLFLMGTIVAMEQLPTEDPFDYLFYNFAPLYYGSNRFLVPKRYVSNIDFLTPSKHSSSTTEIYDQPLHTAHMVPSPHDHLQKHYASNVWHAYKDELQTLGYRMLEYSWLYINDLQVSVEICFDHQMRRALDAYLANAMMHGPIRVPSTDGPDRPLPTTQADLSLISSAGMTLFPPALVLTDGGVALLQDGLSNATMQTVADTEECTKGDLAFVGGFEAVRRTAVWSETDIVLDHALLPRIQRVALPLNLTGVFSGLYAPTLHVMEPTDLPMQAL